MTLLYVTVVGNLGPAAAGAKGYWVPTGWLTAAADSRVIPPAPAPPFTIGADGSFTSGPLLAQDSPGVQPQGEAWTLSINGIDEVAPWSQTYGILHSNGATQDLASLPVAAPSQTFTDYLLAENNLSDVDDAATALANLGGASTAALNAETTRAEGAEASLAAGVAANSVAIAAETTRAEGAETTLAGGVSTNAAAITAETTRAETAEAALVPQFQVQPAPGGTPQTITPFQVQPAGTTDTLGPFSDLFSVQTYGTSPPVTETVWMTGYNLVSAYGAPNYNPANSSIYTYIHPDAGDTNVSGAHGLEWGVGVIGPHGAWSVNMIELLAVNDSAGTCLLSFRCGSGPDGNIVSGFSFGDSAGTSYLNMGPTLINSAPAASFGTDLYVSHAGVASLQLTSTDNSAVLSVSANTGFNPQLNWKLAGTTQWRAFCGATFFAITDVVNNHTLLEMTPSATQAFSNFDVMAQLQCYYNVVLAQAALATTATTGFTYIPTCPGVPTGVPGAKTGTVPIVYDTTDQRLYFYESGAWHYTAMTA